MPGRRIGGSLAAGGLGGSTIGFEYIATGTSGGTGREGAAITIALRCRGSTPMRFIFEARSAAGTLAELVDSEDESPATLPWSLPPALLGAGIEEAACEDPTD